MTSDPLAQEIKLLFTDDNAKRFLSKYWQERRQLLGIPSAGFCYLASHTFYQLVDDNQIYMVKKWTPKDQPEIGHFWVESLADGKIIDLTADQFPGGYPFYGSGKKAIIRTGGSIAKFMSLILVNG
jgi:hypothetical protein